MRLRNRNKFNENNIFFITTTCYKWLHLLSIGQNKNIIISNLTHYCNKYKANILAYVIMPNHIHLIIHFTKGIERIGFIRDFKKYTATQIRKEIEKKDKNLLEKLRYEKGKQKFKIWQDRYDELYLQSKELLEQKLLYIHLNPLQEHWQLALEPKEYKYSSAAFYEEEIQRELKVKHYAEFL